MEMQAHKVHFRAPGSCALPFSNFCFHWANAEFLDQEARGFHAPGPPAAFLRKLCCEVALCLCVTAAAAEIAQYCKAEERPPKKPSADGLKEN